MPLLIMQHAAARYERGDGYALLPLLSLLLRVIYAPSFD